MIPFPYQEPEPEIYRTRAALANRPGLFIAGCVDRSDPATLNCPAGSSFAFYGVAQEAVPTFDYNVVGLSCRQGQPVCQRATILADPTDATPPCGSVQQRAVVCRQQ